MKRDADIQKIFETADDSLQGVLGYHLYVIAMERSANVERIWKHLPDQRIPITFSWDRFYSKRDLTNAFKSPFFELWQSRISLVAITSVFEVALKNFILSLNQKRHSQFLAKQVLKEETLSYRKCIKWAYYKAIKCDIGDEEAIKRLPNTFGIVDDARRLRNLIVHNHGLFNEFYEKDAIDINGIVKHLHPHYQQVFQKNPARLVPIVITSNLFIDFCRAHIEVLHILHNYIQKEYFGFTTAYSYLRQKKRIEWNKVLWGGAKVKIQMTK